jgi:MFS family permease
VKLPFFYGWIIVAVAMLTGFLASGLSNITMAVVLKPISQDLGWSRMLTAAAITMGSIAGGLLGPLVGPLADRFGPRLLLPAGAGLVGGLVIALSLSTEPWQFYATFVPARALAETLLMGVVSMTAVTNWFDVKRPRAMGLVALSVPLGSSVLSLVYQFLISNYGWRSAFLALGVSFWIFIVGPALLFLRRQPEDLGLLPDGMTSARPIRSAKASAEIQSLERSWKLSEAMGTVTLWLLISAAFSAAIATGGIAFHLVAYYTDVQIAPGIAAGALSVMALSGACGNGLWGALAERFHPRLLSVSTMILSAAAVAVLIQVHAPAMAYVFAILFGANARSSGVLTQILMAHYYGRRSYGAISSVLEPFHKGGLGLGALVAGLAFDYAGNYQTVFVVFLLCYLSAGALFLLATQPEKKSP